MSDGHGINVLLTFDFEEWEGRGSIYQADLVGKTTRVINMLKESELPATFFLDADTALKYPQAVGGIADGDFELALHSDFHPGATRPWELPSGVKTDEVSDFRQNGSRQSERMLRAVSMIRQVIPGFRPEGFRAPFLRWNEELYSTLSGLGFKYDSSQMQMTHRPFLKKGIVVIPVNCAEWDSACYKMRPQYVVYQWKISFNRACQIARETGESYFLLLAHPSVIGKRKYLGMLKAILNYVSWAKPKYLTCSDFARKVLS